MEGKLTNIFTNQDLEITIIPFFFCCYLFWDAYDYVIFKQLRPYLSSMGWYSSKCRDSFDDQTVSLCSGTLVSNT